MKDNNFIKKEVFPNGVTFFIVDYDLGYDLVVKFKNFGGELDQHTGISGMQHLLEHTIFSYSRNLNYDSNASTTMNYMSVELDLSSKVSESSLVYLKKWLFRNEDYSKIDISRNLSEEEIKCYIDELDSEFIYRKSLDVVWDLKPFLLSGGEYHFFGGNKKSFKGKEDKIKKYLANPHPIAPEDIVIYLSKNREGYYKILKSIFSQIKQVKKPPLKLKYRDEKFNNKFIQLNNARTNDLNFILSKKEIGDNMSLLYYMKLLYPFFDFSNSSMDDIFLSFDFDNLKELYSFINILENRTYSLLSLNNLDKYINFFPMRYLDVDNYPDDILKLYYDRKNITYDELYKNQNQNIKSFFEILTNKIINKRFFINNTKSALMNRTTDIGENYNMVDIIFERNFYPHTFNIRNYYEPYYFSLFEGLKKENGVFSFSKRQTKCKHLCCFSKKDVILDFETGFKASRSYNFNDSGSYPLNFFIESLICFYIFPHLTDLEKAMEYVRTDRSVYRCINNKINLCKNEYHITTEHDFIFFVLKTSKDKAKSMSSFSKNIEEILKRNGLTYYLVSTIVPFKTFSLTFFYTNSRPENFKSIKNTFKTNILSHRIGENYNIVISNKPKNNLNIRDVYSLKKEIKIEL